MWGSEGDFAFVWFRFYCHYPPELQEHGGLEDPAKEARLEAQLKAEQHHWISAAKKTAQKGLDQARANLRKAGISAGTLQALFSEPGEGPDAADDIRFAVPDPNVV